MQRYQIMRFGLEHLTLADAADPTPGPGQVVVGIKAVSLNYRDMMMVAGQYDPNLAPGRVPCSDGAGVVLATGPGVRGFKVGDRVVSSFFQNWTDGPISSAKMRGALGGDVDGTLTSHAVLSETGLTRIPDGLSFVQAATLPCAAVTAWNALFGGPRPVGLGDSVLVQGTGGVSVFALQLARAAGARVIITSSSDEKLARAKAMGAEVTINYKSTPDWEKPAREASGGGVDVVVEVGGAGTLGKSIKAVRTGGTIALIGVLAGVRGEVDTVSILMRSIDVRGINVGSLAMLQSVVRAVGTTGGGVEPVIDRVFPFALAKEAFGYMKTGQHMGKVVIELP